MRASATAETRSRYNKGQRLLTAPTSGGDIYPALHFGVRPITGIEQKRIYLMSLYDEETTQQQRRRGFWGRLKNRKVLRWVFFCLGWVWRIYRFISGEGFDFLND